jgi:hypothetical protein
LHRMADPAASFGGHQVAMEGFAGERARDGAVGADEPEIEAELVDDGQSEGVTTAGHDHDFDSGGVGAAQRREIAVGNFELWIEQGAVDIGRQQPDRRLGHH